MALKFLRASLLRKTALMGAVGAVLMVPSARAQNLAFDLPAEPLAQSLDAFARISGKQVLYMPDQVDGKTAPPLRGSFTPDIALSDLIAGSGLSVTHTPSGGAVIGPAKAPIELAQVSKPTRSGGGAGVETVVVTAQKKAEDIQQVPIAITALSQTELTARQIAGGPDLVKEVPNLTFSKTNFSGYNLEIRGIGTQAISVTTDPAVAVALNSTPFIRNHFFEQEFYDLQDVEVLRGPQGTLYGRNATAGVVNVVSARPTDQFEAMGSADFGNYDNRRLEGMINIPIVGDKLDIRMAGEWTKRDGYTDDTTLDEAVDGRDLWSTRLNIGWKPSSDVQTEFVWEHFSEDDDRLRSGKQLCKTDPGPSSFTAADGTVVPVNPSAPSAFQLTASTFSQGCAQTQLYSPQAFEVPNAYSLPFVSGASFLGYLTNVNPYASTVQSTNLRDIQSALLPHYVAKNDTLELNTDWKLSGALTFTSQTGYNSDYLWSSEDYNRFDTAPGVFVPGADNGNISAAGVFCDPQLGCSNRLVVQDLSTERAWQFSQEFRLASNYDGPANFSVGANYLHYETDEKYYVFSNTFSMISLNNLCQIGPFGSVSTSPKNSLQCQPNGAEYLPPQNGGGVPTESPQYIDPNPLASVNGEGHNYFLSDNPYVLNSYAAFGETYYDITKDLELTAGLRFTDDQKQFIDIPSQLLTHGYGYPSIGSVQQQWDQFTGRFVANYSPDLPFTDHSMFYASYAHGYKAGGANPPGPVLIDADVLGSANINFPDHPETFKPEFIEAFELGTKNTALDNALTINADIFYYNYHGYQISEIVDRSAINLNFNANVEGAELESNWEPIPGLKFSFAGGFETSSLASGSQAIDLMARADQPGWTIMKPSVGQSSNCVFPNYVAAALLKENQQYSGLGNPLNSACAYAYFEGLDPVTGLPYVANPTQVNSQIYGNLGITVPAGYPGFNPASAPNNGEGFNKNLTGNQLPNAPHFTTSLTAEYTIPVNEDWAATFHTDFYWQSQQWARVFEDPIDKIHGYSNVNLSLILTNDSGWQVMGYVKNVFNTTAITGTFLNSDDSGLTTNVFLTDPRLYGIRVTKQLDGGDWPTGGISFLPDLFSDSDNGKPPLWIEMGGDWAMLDQGRAVYTPGFTSLTPAGLPSPVSAEKAPAPSFDWQTKVSFEPADTDWVFSAAVRYGRSGSNAHLHRSLPPPQKTMFSLAPGFRLPCPSGACKASGNEFEDVESHESEYHAVLDFTVGKDVGLGDVVGSSILGGGIRVAQFTEHANSQFNADPVYKFEVPSSQKYHDIFNASALEKRSFHGVGPTVTWDANAPLTGESSFGTLTGDWGLNGAVLFGRQSAHIADTLSKARCGAGTLALCYGQYNQSQSVKRARTIVVPNFGAYAGVSMRWNNAKVSFGYRVDEFFGAMDGGQMTYKSENRGFYGPYAKITLGLGG